MQPMELSRVPLDGMNLVEASAGTGKTYTLSGLYLRLLVERSLSPQQILVVTYTKAATAELKARIRQRLLQARDAFGAGRSEDALLDQLLRTQPDPERVLRQLRLAIAAFDQAAIHTIHGFCQRVLNEHALETAQRFDVQLVPDQESRLQQIVDDFWRTRLVGLSAALTDQIQATFGHPEGLLAAVRQGLGKPYLELRGAAWPEHLEPLEGRIAARLQLIRSAWQEQGERITRFLSDKRRFDQRTYRCDRVRDWCEQLQAWLAQEPPDPRGFAWLEKFTRSSVTAGLKRGQTLLETDLFDQFQTLKALYETTAELHRQAMCSLRQQCYEYVCEELPRRQQADGEWSYDDLLLQLDRALAGAAGGRLAAALRQRYPAALVDEFQDTDPLQYHILTRLYGEGRRTLFLVGDPKQAIYSFRGADIFAYLQARRAIRQQFGLTVNWRSTPPLIDALNTLFGAHAAAFFFPQIPYRPVTPAPDRPTGLVEKGDREGPLRIWRLSSPEGESRLPELRREVADATANEIARLLKAGREERLTLDGAPLGGGDIAVLVRTHRQGEQIALALSERGIHSVRTAQDNVFLSREAEQLERLLLALLEPRRESLLRAALATDLLGWRGEEIERLNRDDGLLARQFERALEYHQCWRDAGFMRLFRRLLDEVDMERRLLARCDGERRLTNLYQLAELIHRYETEVQPGIEGVLRWFSRQCRDESAQEEERQLRLESDSHLVKIVTQHASKGLQYPVVFCPYLWDETLGLRSGQQSYLYHDPRADHAPVFELGSAGFEAAQRYFKQEQLAENLRLLYVALTRARYRCYLVWGQVKHSENAALAWLLHPVATSEGDPLAAWQAAYRRLDEAAIQRRLHALAEQSGGAISLAPLPSEAAASQLEFSLPPTLAEAREFRGEIRSGPRIGSFSSLVADGAPELPDHDAAFAAEEPMQQALLQNIHGFPRGPQPGTCLHSIFEQLDFTRDSRGPLEQLVGRVLAAHTIPVSWTAVVTDMVEAVLAVDLDGSGLRLREIGKRQRVTEMGFHFPVRRLEPGLLEALAREHGFAACAEITSMFGQLTFSRLQGFLTGFIDLVIEFRGRFYVLDYKSNWLGDTQADYTQAALRRAMLTHQYPLQYLFYVLALHRYLRRRLAAYDYARHFGGVFYLFLRGMDPRAGNRFGVYQERPPQAFIEALDARLTEAGS